MNRIFVFVIIIVIMATIVLVGCAQPAMVPTPKSSPTSTPSSTPEKVIELRFAHQNAPAARTTVKFINAWAKQVEQVTNGKVKITMYPAESLAKAGQELEAILGGMADFTWSIMGYYTGRFPLSSVTALPFLCLSSGKIDGKPRSSAAVNSHIQQELYETLPEIQAEWKDVKVLYLFCTDPYQLFTSKKPVRNMGDLKGLKIRELGGYPSEMWKLFGATPATIPMPDVYDATSKGVIDGGNLPWSAFSAFKLYEVFKYWVDAPTIPSPQFVIMNLDKWHSLSPDIQKAIMSVSGYTGAEFAGDSGWGFEVKNDILALAQKAGITLEKTELMSGEFDRWKEVAGKPIWDRWVSDMKAKGLNGQKILDTTNSLLKKYSP